MSSKELKHPDLPDQPFELRCHRCKTLLASGLVALRDRAPLCDRSKSPRLPAGACMPSEYALADRGDDEQRWYGTAPEELLVNTNELTTVSGGHGDWSGCCGPTGLSGPTLRCRNGHDIGTEVGDCTQPHFSRLSRRWVEVCLPEWGVTERLTDGNDDGKP